MSTHTDNPIRGSTASGALPPPRPAPPGEDAGRPRPALGDLLRAAGVFLDTAFRVVVLGSDGTPDRRSGAIPGQERRDRWDRRDG